MLIASCLFYTKFEIIQLPREESAAESNVLQVERCFCKCWWHWHCEYLQI